MCRQRKKSHIAKSGERGGQDQSPRLLITFPRNLSKYCRYEILFGIQLGNRKKNFTTLYIKHYNFINIKLSTFFSKKKYLVFS